MNVNGNSTRWFLQSSMSKFFSQKNLNKSDISGQTATNPNSGVKYKHSYLYYNENGVPCFSKEQAERCLKGRTDCRNIVSVSEQVKADLAEVVKQDFVSTNGWGIPEGSKRHDVVNNYLSTLPAKQCASASWTLIKMAGDYAERLQALVRENNPDGNRVMPLIQIFWISLMVLSEVWILKYRYYKSRRIIIWQWKL